MFDVRAGVYRAGLNRRREYRGEYIGKMDSTYILLFRTYGSTALHCPCGLQGERRRCERDG